MQMMILSIVKARLIRSNIWTIKGFPATSSNIFFGNRVDFNRAVMKNAVFIYIESGRILNLPNDQITDYQQPDLVSIFDDIVGPTVQPKIQLT